MASFPNDSTLPTVCTKDAMNVEVESKAILAPVISPSAPVPRYNFEPVSTNPLSHQRQRSHRLICFLRFLCRQPRKLQAPLSPARAWARSFCIIDTVSLPMILPWWQKLMGVGNLHMFQSSSQYSLLSQYHPLKSKTCVKWQHTLLLPLTGIQLWEILNFVCLCV